MWHNSSDLNGLVDVHEYVILNASMIDSLLLDSKGSVQNSLSAYQPSNDGERELCLRVKRAYEDGDKIQHQPFKEFNNKSLLERMSIDQRNWLSWTPEPFEGEDDWRWNGIRPITRNKVIATAAHLTAQLLIPNVFAQNDQDEEDRATAFVMRDLVEYNIKRSNYETAFLYGVIGALVNPVSYFKVEFTQGWQEIWQDGEKTRVIDDMFSGFQNSLLSPEDVLISNAYQFDIQKQDWILEKKGHISYGQAEALYGEYDNFQYVQPGVKRILNDDGNFYDVEDVNGDLIEYVCYKNRRNDEEIHFLGGVYMGNPNVHYNPFTHRTNKNKPKYDIAKFGYEPIDQMRFFYYKSLVAKMENDQEAADRQWQMYFDSSFLATFPPTVTMGAGKIDRSVISPATNTELGKDGTITPLNIANPGVALQALREAERSLEETSISNQMGGMEGDVEKTRGESVLLQQNADTNLGLATKMIATAVRQIGDLMVDDIIKYQTIAEVSEITGKETYKTFLVDGKVKGGKDKTSYIRFTNRHMGQELTEEEKDMKEYELMDEAGDDREIHEVNPALFARMNYLITIDADKMMQRNDAFDRAFKLETYDRAIQNPLVMADPEAQLKITRDFLLEPLMAGEASKYLPNIQKVAQSLVPPEQGGGSDMAGRMVQSAALTANPML
jgi:hypothetical protein